jgi:hypothetical protein
VRSRRTFWWQVQRAPLIAGPLLAACFDPTFRDPTCGSAGECPGDLVCSAGPRSPCVVPGALHDAASVDASAFDATASDAPDAAASDAEASDARASDARSDAIPADAGPPCDDTQPFGTPVPVGGAVNTAADERGATLTPDELTLYVSRAVPGRGFDILVATRPDVGADWGEPEPVAVANSTADETRPTISRDRTSLVLASSASGDGDLYGSYRSDPDADFPVARIITAYSEPDARDVDPFHTFNGQLFWARAGRLWETRKPQGIGPVSGDLPQSTTGAPVLSRSGGHLYFSHDDGNGGGLDVWLARRWQDGVPFEQSQMVPDLSWPTADEQPEWISDDLCRIYLSSNRPGGRGGFDLWVAERTRR